MSSSKILKRIDDHQDQSEQVNTNTIIVRRRARVATLGRFTNVTNFYFLGTLTEIGNIYSIALPYVLRVHPVTARRPFNALYLGPSLLFLPVKFYLRRSRLEPAQRESNRMTYCRIMTGISTTALLTYSTTKLAGLHHLPIGNTLAATFGYGAFAITGELLNHHIHRLGNCTVPARLFLTLYRSFSAAAYLGPIVNTFTLYLNDSSNTLTWIVESSLFGVSMLYETARLIHWWRHGDQIDNTPIRYQSGFNRFEYGVEHALKNDFLFNLTYLSFFFNLLVSLYDVFDNNHDNVPPAYFYTMVALILLITLPKVTVDLVYTILELLIGSDDPTNSAMDTDHHVINEQRSLLLRDNARVVILEDDDDLARVENEKEEEEGEEDQEKKKLKGSSQSDLFNIPKRRESNDGKTSPTESVGAIMGKDATEQSQNKIK